MGNAKYSTYKRLRLYKQVHFTGDKEMFIIAQRAIILGRKVIEQQHGTDILCDKQETVDGYNTGPAKF
jgi:hypothetical protein